MFQLLFETALFKFNAKGPTCRPLLQLPPTIASQNTGAYRAPTLAPIKFSLLCCAYLLAGEDPRTPCGYAAGCSQERAAPKLQALDETAKLKNKAKGPTGRPEAQSPPTNA